MKLPSRGWLASAALALPLVAQAEPAQPPAPNPMIQFVMLGGFVLLFYFLLWRPQSKRAKEHKALVGALGKGDEVLTNGGLAGRITRVKDEFIVLQVAENVEIKVQRSAVSMALPKGTLKDI